MVLAQLTVVLALFAIGCGGIAQPERDAAADATVDSVAADAREVGLDDSPCTTAPAGRDFKSCCAGKLCFGLCADSGECACGNIPGGCEPQLCCQDNPVPTCQERCGPGQ